MVDISTANQRVNLKLKVNGRPCAVHVEPSRMVSGGVAPAPWRDDHIEQALRGRSLSEDTAARASADAVIDTSPLSHNRYKHCLARPLVKQTLLQLCQPSKVES